MSILCTSLLVLNRELCNIAWQLEPALPTLTCYLPSVSSSSATTRVSMAHLVVFFDGSWALVLRLLEEKRRKTTIY